MEWAAKALARATGTNIDVEEFTTVAIFCGAGLLVSLAVAMIFGPDVLIWAIAASGPNAFGRDAPGRRHAHLPD
jgi:hypothetical protein